MILVAGIASATSSGGTTLADPLTRIGAWVVPSDSQYGI